MVYFLIAGHIYLHALVSVNKSCMLGMRVDSGILVKRNWSIVPSKMQILLFPLLLIPAQIMHLDWILSFGLRLWFLPLLSTTKSTMVFQLDSTFFGPHYVFKVITLILICPFKPFLFVSFSNKLTICTATKCPPQRSPASQKSS